MRVVNNQFSHLEFVFNSVYVDLKYNANSLMFTTGSVGLCGVCSHVVYEVVLAPYDDAVFFVTVMRVLSFVLDVSMLRQCEGDDHSGVGDGEMWLG